MPGPTVSAIGKRVPGRSAVLMAALLGAVAVTSACGVGRGSLAASGGLPNPSQTVTTSPPDGTPRPTPGATPSPSFEVIGKRIAAGTHTARPFDPAVSDHGVCSGQSGCIESPDDDSIRITFTVPDGWALAEEVAVTKPSASTVAPSGMSLHFLRGGWLFRDPCLKVDTVPDIEVGPSADDFAEALAAHPLLDTTTPVDVTLGGFSGKYLDLQVPSDISGCTAEYYPWAPAFYAQGPNHRWHIWSLDVEGVRVVIQNGDFAGTLPEDLAEMHAIIKSIQIKP
jgi:hypothetical protein